MSQHCAQLELLSLVMDHEATPGEEQEWHSHLQGCASCQKAAQALGQWRSTMVREHSAWVQRLRKRRQSCWWRSWAIHVYCRRQYLC